MVVILVIILALKSHHSSTSEYSNPVVANIPAPTEGSQTDQNFDNKLDTVLAGISQLNSGLNNLSQRVAELEQSADSEPAVTGQASVDDAYSEADLQANYHSFIASLDTDFAAEALSADFSEQHQNAMQNLFLNVEKPNYQNVQVKNLECRSSSCKVELVLEGSDNSEDFESDFMIDAAKLGLTRVRGYEKSESGQDSYVYFLSAVKPKDAMER